jgi:flagellar biogenesis protein FliO|uniref:Flagellar biosynthetic protein FliO n=1 Tax=Desulfobacca acetoxidans TaxID=60893 RepID=A0A7C5AMK8_9BACT
MHSFGAPELFFWHQAVKVLAVLSGLAGVLFLGPLLMKKYRASRRASPALIRVLETQHLSPQTALHLVAVGPARFLLGNTGKRLTLLTPLPAPSPTREETAEAPLPHGKVE